MGNERVTIDDITRTISTLDGTERMVIRDNNGDAKILTDTLLGTSAAGIASAINNADEKNPPIDADMIGIWDSVASALKKLSWSNIKATLKTYFDTLYLPITSRRNDHITIDPINYSAITQGTWVFAIDAGQYKNGVVYNSTAVLDDKIDYIFSCEAGTWTFKLLGITTKTGGRIHVLIDNVAVDSIGGSAAYIDQYSAGVTYNVSVSITGIVIPEGIHTLSLKLASKHASSSDYIGRISTLALWRTA